jgi:TRAP-type C4-dicarboxylate transport system substrate-binding protein
MSMRMGVLAAAAAVALAGWAGSATAEQTVIRLETYAGPKHAMNMYAWPTWIKQVEEASGGKIKVDMSYPPINPRDLYDRVRNGIADMAWITHGYTTGRFVLTDIVELPGVDGNAEQMSKAFWRISQQYLAKVDEHKGVVVLALFTHGPGMIHSRKPINSIKDFDGLKVRTGGGVQSDIAKRLNMVSVSAPATKAHEILSQGVADGIMFSLETITSFKLADVVKYHYYLPGGLYTASFAVVMNKAKYASLSADEKTALAKVTGEPMSALMGRTWDDADKFSADELKKSGNHVANLDPATAAEVKKRIADIEDEWVAKAKKEGLQDPKAALKALRDEIAKLKQGS